MLPIVVQALIDLISEIPCQDPPVALRGAASKADSAEARRHRGENVAGRRNKGGPGLGDSVPMFSVPGPAPQPQGCPPVDSRHREECPRHKYLGHPCSDERSCQEKRRRRELPMCRKNLLRV
jgi:hypothetical protein